MEQGMLKVFVREAERQANFGLTAAADLDCAIASKDNDRVWYSIQSLLVAAANLSKLLWPPKEYHMLRGDILRTKLEVSDDSPLASRDARNHLEHFDERVDRWDISPERHMVIDSNIGPSGTVKGGSSPVYVRNYDPSTQTLRIYDEAFELRPVVQEIEKLKSVADQILRRT